jgi:hypothetical protein
MSVLGVVITDGVGFRNFVLSDFLKESQNQFDSVVIFSCLPKTAFKDFENNFKIIELEVFNEKFPTWFFRKTKEVAHLQHFSKDFFGINDNLKAVKKSSFTTRGIATQFILKWTTFFNSEKWIQLYNSLQQLSFSNHFITKNYIEQLKKENINQLFFTHQRPPFIAPLIFSAEKLKIKTTTFIFSWDNLASKGRMAGNFNNYLVWSDLMKSELLYFYKYVDPKNISVVGTPQFEPYVLERYYQSENDFYKQFDLDVLKPIICYSCADSATSQNDNLYIQTIANAILNKKIVKDVTLFVRTSPAEEPTRFMQLAIDFPFIKWNYPKWKLSRENHQEAWSQRIPSVEDVKDLRAILNYCDVSVNMCSTMSLDFMLFDKPVINPVFGNQKNGLYNDQRFLNFAHYAKVVESEAVYVVKNESELIESINIALQNPLDKNKEQKELLQLQISEPLANTSKRIAQTLKNWN